MCLSIFLLARAFFKPPENSHSLHPSFFDWSSGVGGTESFTSTGVSTQSSGSEVGSYSGSTVDGDLLFDDKTVLDVSSDVMSAVGVADGQRFIWVEPDFVSAAVEDRSG